MMQRKMKQAAAYFKSRLLRFLLLAVLLTSGFSMNYAAQAKYAAYLSDYSSAVADDLCFASNYLGEKNSNTEYDIGTWNGRRYKITLEIRNFQNSLRYNKSGENLYYYVTADVYQMDDTTGELSPNGAFTSTILYDVPDDAERYYYGETECAYLPGMAAFDHKAGTQEVTVSVDSAVAVSKTQYLVIRAHTIPTAEVGQIKVGSPDSAQGADPTPGVFDITLESVFVLNMGSTAVEISYDLSQSKTDYTVICKLICGNISGSTMGIIRVYFDSDKLDPDVNLGQVYPDSDGGTHVKVPMYSESIKNCFFFKKTMDASITDGKDIFIQLEEGEIVGADDETGNGNGGETGDGTGDGTGSETGSGTGDGTGNETGSGTGSGTGNETGSGTGSGTGDGTGNETGSGTGNGNGGETGGSSGG